MKLIPIKTNMTEAEINGNLILFSYQTPVAIRTKYGMVYKTSKKWSTTTSKHIGYWLNMRAFVNVELMSQDYFDGVGLAIK